MNKGFCIEAAAREDVPVIFAFIKELAVYEKMEELVIGGEALLESELFDKRHAEVLIGRLDGAPVGFALFFHNFSTFLTRSGIYIEDIYMRPESRGRGFGRQFFARIAAIAKERGCGRVEWSCLDWNEPSIRFYRSLGAQPMDGWTTYRLSGDQIEALAE